MRNQEKTVSAYFWRFCNCLFLSWLKFLPFLPKFYCFIVSKHERATVVISQKWRSRPVNNLKVKHLKSHVRHDDPEIMSISHIHVLLLSSAISLIVSLTLPSWSPVLVLNLTSLILRRATWEQDNVERTGQSSQLLGHLISSASSVCLECDLCECIDVRLEPMYILGCKTRTQTRVLRNDSLLKIETCHYWEPAL